MANVATSVEARNKSLVRDRFEAWAQGNGSPFELLAEDASWTIEGGSVASKTYVGRETFMREPRQFQIAAELRRRGARTKVIHLADFVALAAAAKDRQSRQPA